MSDLITEKQYNEAKKIVDNYENQLNIVHILRLKILKTELKEYFKNNKVDGIIIDGFDLVDNYGKQTYSIIPDNPVWQFDEHYSGDNDSDIEKISDKCGIKVRFIYTMYPK